MAITIQVGFGAALSLDQLGIESAILTDEEGGGGQLTMTVGELVSESPFGDGFDKVTVRDDGVVRWVGYIVQRPQTEGGGRDSRTYVAQSPAYWLDQALYRQTYFIWDTVNEVFVETVNASGVVVLNQKLGGTGGDEPEVAEAGEQLEEILGAAIAEFGSVLTYSASDTAALTEKLPEDKQVGATCRSLVNRITGLLPDRIVRWDYSSGTPSLRFQPLSSMTARSLNESSIQITARSLNPRYDLLAKSTEITYIHRSDPDGYALLTLDTAGPGGDAASLGCDYVERATIELRPATNCAAAEEIPVGVAAANHEWRSRLHIDGEFTANDGFNWAWRPGDRWTFAGKVSAYAGYESIAMVLTRDLRAGSVSVRIGARHHVGLGNAIQLTRALRSRGDSTSVCRNGQPPTPAQPVTVAGGPLSPVAIPGTPDVWVLEGFVGSEQPTNTLISGSQPHYLFSGLTGSGVIYIEQEFDEDTGTQGTVSVKIAASLPSSDVDTIIYPLGNYSVSDDVVSVSAGHTSGNLQWRACPVYYSGDRVFSGEVY